MQVTQKKSQVFGLNEIEEVFVMLKLSYITEVARCLGNLLTWQGTAHSLWVWGQSGRGSGGLWHTPPPSLTGYQTGPALITKANSHSVKWQSYMSQCFFFFFWSVVFKHSMSQVFLYKVTSWWELSATRLLSGNLQAAWQKKKALSCTDFCFLSPLHKENQL